MGILEENDLRKELQRKSSRYKDGLEEEVRQISDRTEKMITNALIIGGTLALTYFLIRQFSGGKGGKKVQREKTAESTIEEKEVPAQSQASNLVTKIGTALASQAAFFLLTLAKEKLTDYLKEQAEKKNL